MGASPLIVDMGQTNGSVYFVSYKEKNLDFLKNQDASKSIENQGLAKNGYQHQICRIFLPHFHYFPPLGLHGMTHSAQF